jgi:ribosomal protein L40E
LFPNPYSTSRCCPRDKHLAFGLEPVVAEWLKKQRVEPEPSVVQQVVHVLTSQTVPGFGLIRDEITGDPKGFTWLQRAIYGGERYWSGKVCQRCFEPVYAHETVCRACGSNDLRMVQTETWEQAEERRQKGWNNLWRTLGLRRPG